MLDLRLEMANWRKVAEYRVFGCQATILDSVILFDKYNVAV